MLFDTLVTIGTILAIVYGLQWAFRKMTTPNPAITETAQSATDFCRDVMRRVGEVAFAKDSLEREALSIYAIGGVYAVLPFRRLSVAQIRAIVMTVYDDCFGYSFEDCAAKARVVMTAADDPTSHLHGIIAQGVDGFLVWQKNRDEFDIADFQRVVTKLQEKRPA